MANARKNFFVFPSVRAEKRLRAIGIGIGMAVCLLFSPLVSGVNNLGTWFGMGVGLLLAIIGGLLPNLIVCVRAGWKTGIGRGLLIGLGLLLCAFGIWALSLIGLMIARATANEIPKEATVIVLGCKVNGETPSKALSQRLQAALAYLEAHPDAICILSGGQGSDESISEAEAMRRYLVEQGIMENRLLLEERSTDTGENLRYSVALIEKLGLNRQVAIVTHSYHQCRAALEAEDVGLTPYAVNAKSSPLSYPTFFLRDLLGVAHKTVFG